MVLVSAYLGRTRRVASAVSGSSKVGPSVDIKSSTAVKGAKFPEISKLDINPIIVVADEAFSVEARVVNSFSIT